MTDQFKFPVIELVDRYTIARVKFIKTLGHNAEEVKFYQAQVDKLKIELIHKELIELETLHYQIWALEDDFKKCRLDGVDLAEIGRRALAIRDLNNSRIALKNKMAELLQDPVREIKTTL